VRLLLGALLLIAAVISGADPNTALLAFVVGAAIVAFAALTDRRSLLLGAEKEPDPLPADAVVESELRTVARAAYPSTIGLFVLAVVALAADQDALGALLGGADAGLGIASAVGIVRLLAWERNHGVRLYVGEHGRRYVR
jgi:hypothetical protein